MKFPAKATFDGGMAVPTGAVIGRVLTSDGSGNGTWQAAGTLLTGTGVPAAGLGVDGAMYLDLSTARFYGPKTAGAWGAAIGRLVPLTPTYAQLTSG